LYLNSRNDNGARTFEENILLIYTIPVGLSIYFWISKDFDQILTLKFSQTHIHSSFRTYHKNLRRGLRIYIKLILGTDLLFWYSRSEKEERLKFWWPFITCCAGSGPVLQNRIERQIFRFPSTLLLISMIRVQGIKEIFS